MANGFVLQIFLLFVLPLLLLHFRIIKLKYIFPTIWTVFIIVIIIVVKKQIPLIDLGIRFDNILQAALPYALIIIFGGLLIYLLAKKLKKEPFKNWWRYYHFQFGFIILALFQEFTYRSFLMYELRLIDPSFIFVILVNALLFSLMHVIFIDSKIVVPATFIAGLVFASVYYFYPNLLLITICHAALNFIAAYYNFFKIPMRDRLRKK